MAHLVARSVQLSRFVAKTSFQTVQKLFAYVNEPDDCLMLQTAL